jgi:hypothetical protein
MPLIDILPPIYATIPVQVQYKLGVTNYVFRNAASFQDAGQWAGVPGFTVTTDKRKNRI